MDFVTKVNDENNLLVMAVLNVKQRANPYRGRPSVRRLNSLCTGAATHDKKLVYPFLPLRLHLLKAHLQGDEILLHIEAQP